MIVQPTPDFRRVAGLPRRVPDGARYVDDVTRALRQPTGTMTLFPDQALCLAEAAIHRRLVCGMGVGEGKTIVSMLLPAVIGAKKPLLLLPGALAKKTQRERAILVRHWRIPPSLRVMSYEKISVLTGEKILEHYRPDLIIADEAHALKNTNASVSRRVARYLSAHPDCVFIPMSGTFVSRSIADTAHLFIWALREHAPVPTSSHEIDIWAQATDEELGQRSRAHPGALLTMPVDVAPPSTAPNADVIRARDALRKRLSETPSVVLTRGGGDIAGVPILVRAIMPKYAPITDEHFLRLRWDYQTPDGWECASPVDVWRHARELACGLHYIWDPRPPTAWLDARRAWCAFVRDVIMRSQSLDSESAVASAVRAGGLPRGAVVLGKWERIRPTFEPVVRGIWHDDSILNTCMEWMKKPGIVWTRHDLFARELSRVTGASYYGAGGLDSKGRSIEKGAKNEAIIASIAANSKGRNLQSLWSRNLIVCPGEGTDEWQQLIGRTHRTGQTADAVLVDVLIGCREHARAWQRAYRGTASVGQMTGQRYRLQIADVDMPSDEELESLRGPRWNFDAKFELKNQLDEISKLASMGGASEENDDE